MSGTSNVTRKVDVLTNQPVEKLQFDVDTHDDYLQLRQAFAAMPKIPMLLHLHEAPTETAPKRKYNWLLTSEQSGGSIVIHVLTLEPGFAAEEHHHTAEEEFFFILDGQLEITIGSQTALVGAGGFAYAPPNCTHAFRTFGDSACRVLHWNSPGGHERLATARQRLVREGRTGGDDVRRVTEAHEYIFHDPSRFTDPSGR
jgi:mannose-6-phosphate isomerase-like protein (cupin superfamily)